MGCAFRGYRPGASVDRDGAHPSLVVVDEHVDFSTVVGDEPICPDCRDDKHKACVGSAWDDTHDAPAVCDCWERWPEIHQP
jgi:hypothetical protein